MGSESTDSANTGPGSIDWGPNAYSMVRDFLIDVLGSLVGLLFIIAVCGLVITSGTCFLDVFGRRVTQEPTFGILLRTSVDAFHAWILFIVAYVVGGIFHRLDPKRPDRKSLERALGSVTTEGLEHFEVQTRESERKSWLWRLRISYLTILDHVHPRPDGILGRVDAAKISTSIGAHFPYSHIQAYLKSRELDHLAEMVTWESDKRWSGCSKMFVNVLKIRMQWAAPRKCGEIVRNEAHVRMMSSIWFAARSVFSVFWVSTLPVLAAVWRLNHTGEPLDTAQFSHDFVVYLAVASFAILSAFWLKRNVESRFHYQRVKEVVYVLETAYCLKRSGYPEILENLPKPPTS